MKMLNHIFCSFHSPGGKHLCLLFLVVCVCICTITSVSLKKVPILYSPSRLLFFHCSSIMINVQLASSVLIVPVCFINACDDHGIFLVVCFAEYTRTWYRVILNLSVYTSTILPTSSSKKKRRMKEKQEWLKEKFSKKNTDRYPGTRQLVSELFASAHWLYMAAFRSKSVSGIDQQYTPKLTWKEDYLNLIL